jgi:branched-chain amino acid transport system ATP-binding protein
VSEGEGSQRERALTGLETAAAAENRRQEAGLAMRIGDVVTGYGSIEVLHGVSFDVAAGAALGIVGANGAGKTTLLKAISGLLPCTRGSIHVDGTQISGMKPHRIARMGVAHIPEGRQVLQHLTVQDNLYLGSPGKQGRAERVEELLETFPILRDKLRQPGGQLSGGQQQMLAIARALMSRPRLILLDEPTLGLSPKLTDDLYYLLAKIRSEFHASFVLVEQNIALAADLTDRSVVIQRGSVVRIEESKALMQDRDLLQAYLG